MKRQAIIWAFERWARFTAGYSWLPDFGQRPPLEAYEEFNELWCEIYAEAKKEDV